LSRTVLCLCLCGRWLGPVCLAILPLVVAAQENGTEVLNFAVGWRVGSGQPENVLQLGTIYPCARGWCAVVEEFAGGLNLQRQRLSLRHTMRSDTHAVGCVDEYLTTVKGERTGELTAQLTQTGSGYVLEAGRYRYTLSSDPENQESYLLQDVGMIAKSGLQYSQPIGFAYWSDDARESPFERSQYNAYFDGVIAHKDTLTGVRVDWKVSRTSLDFRKFHSATDGSSVLGLTTSGHPEVLKRMNRTIGAHQSLLPPLNTTGERLRYFNHEYGHDFNANGCFDEFGHNKLMLPVLREDVVVAFVFVEYTHDKLDGVPMLSVGRYFRQM